MTTTTPLLIYADSERFADMFHAVPLTIIDPFLYAEVDGRKVVMTSVLERDRILGLDLGIDVLDPTAVGRDELIDKGLDPHTLQAELSLRVCRELGIAEAAVPPEFPLHVADHLRAEGLELTVDAERFIMRRRAKTSHQLEGMRRAQKAADAAMAEGARLVRELPEGLTCEQVRAAMQAVCEEHGAELPDEVIVSHGPQSAQGHESGSGPIAAGEALLIDIWPRDKASRCWADMTRTFVGGSAEPPAELAEYWRLVKASLDAVMPEIKPGASCREIYELSCQPFHEAGQPTQLTKEPGQVLEDGFYHGLGHGVGLEIHERPYLGRGSAEKLIPGDVVTIEPGCYRQGFGGVRLEDLVLVTEDGCEVLTDFPYELN
jgi:Xaa-Pro aminopeptidase